VPQLFICHACSLSLEHDLHRSYLSSGSVLVLRLKRIIHSTRMDPHDLGFSLTNNWCVVWNPPLVAQLYCSSPMSDLSTLSSGTSVHPGDRWLTTLWFPGARASQDTGPHRSWDPAYVAPIVPVVNDARGLVGTQAPQSRAVTCSAKRLSPCPR